MRAVLHARRPVRNRTSDALPRAARSPLDRLADPAARRTCYAADCVDEAADRVADGGGYEFDASRDAGVLVADGHFGDGGGGEGGVVV
jgi:hypothetical protein